MPPAGQEDGTSSGTSCMAVELGATKTKVIPQEAHQGLARITSGSIHLLSWGKIFLYYKF